MNVLRKMSVQTVIAMRRRSGNFRNGSPGSPKQLILVSRHDWSWTRFQVRGAALPPPECLKQSECVPPAENFFDFPTFFENYACEPKFES